MIIAMVVNLFPWLVLLALSWLVLSLFLQPGTVSINMAAAIKNKGLEIFMVKISLLKVRFRIDANIIITCIETASSHPGLNTRTPKLPHPQSTKKGASP